MTLGRLSTNHYLVRPIAALASAFLLLAACTGTTEITMDDTGPIPDTSAVPDRAEPTAEARPTTSPAETQAAQAEPTPTTEILRQVLVVAQLIPKGASVREIVQEPTLYLTSDLVPEKFVHAAALTSIADLAELDGLVLSADALPGEQLLRSRFREPNAFSDPEADDSTPIVTADENTDGFRPTRLAAPAGHVADVLILPPLQAVGGNIRAGEYARIVGTSIGNDGQAESAALVDAVEVLDVETLFDSEADVRAGDVELAITIAVTPAEAASLWDGLADSATITLATNSEQPGEFAVMVGMRQPQALQGQVRRGDVVNVLAVASPGERLSDSLLIASNVHVLTVSSDTETERPETIFWVLLSVTADELLAVTTAVANGRVVLDQ